MPAEKFIQSFIEFMEENFSDTPSRHKFFIKGDLGKYSIKKKLNIYSSEKEALCYYLLLIIEMNKARKIILHGLFNTRLILILAMQPWLLKRCYWVIWGGDLYAYQLNKQTHAWWSKEIFRRFVIKRVGHFITQVEGDYALARQWYGAKGERHDCFMYPSNLYKDASAQSLPHEGINILLGNSAGPSNNHIEALDTLKRYAGEEIKVYCPLSYGDQEYAQQISAYGTLHFGENFIALLEFMPHDKYVEFLSNIDLAIFNHKRQQSMGNITTLLGMGKKVYLRKEITTWSFLKNLGITLFDVQSIELSRLDKNVSAKNMRIVQNYFSEANLVAQLHEIFQ